MAWKHSKENKEARTQKDVNEYLKRKTGEQERIVMKQQVAKKMGQKKSETKNRFASFHPTWFGTNN